MSTVAATTNLTVPIDSEEARCEPARLVLTLTRWGLVATLMAAPLAFGAVQPWAWAGLLIVSFCLLMLWAIAGVQQGELRMHLSTLYIPAALFLLLCVVQLWGGITLDTYATRESIFKLVMVLAFLFVTGQLYAKATRAVWRELGMVVTLYAFALGLFAILQFFSSHNLIYWTVKSDGWTFGPYVNHNDYAGLMEMLIPIASAYVLSRPRTDPRRLLLSFSLAVPVASVLLSGSRGGCVSLMVEVLALGWILWRGADRNRPFGAMLAVAPAASALLFFWMAPNRAVKRLEGLAHPNRTVDVSLAEREQAAADTLRIFRDHPWAGIGLGSFGTVFPQYRTFPTDLGWAHAHNDYAEALAETGVAGGTLILVGLAMFFRRAFGGLSRRLRSEAGWMQIGAAIGCCGLLVHSLVDFNLHIPANALWFVVCLALATAPGMAGKEKTRFET